MNNPFEQLLEELKEIKSLIISRDQLHEAPAPTPLTDIHFTPKEAAIYWRIHEQTILRRARAGLIPFHRAGIRKIFFKKNELDKISANPMKGIKKK